MQSPKDKLFYDKSIAVTVQAQKLYDSDTLIFPVRCPKCIQIFLCTLSQGCWFKSRRYKSKIKSWFLLIKIMIYLIWIDLFDLNHDIFVKFDLNANPGGAKWNSMAFSWPLLYINDQFPKLYWHHAQRHQGLPAVEYSSLSFQYLNPNPQKQTTWNPP